MGTIVELLKIIDKFRKNKMQDGREEESRNFKEALRKEMKKLNKDHIDRKV